MLELNAKWATTLLSQPETGMGYQVVSVVLKNGRRFNKVVVVGGIITHVSDFVVVPFSEADIQDIVVTHEK